MSDWRWAAARAAGTSHARTGLPCQDAWTVGTCGPPGAPVLAAIVSDGAGSARCSREGARLVVRGIGASARSWFADHAEPPGENEVRGWLTVVRDRIDEEAVRRDATARDFAATLVACFAGPHWTLIAHVGDGACVVDGAVDGWTVASWPSNGEFANQTSFVTGPGEVELRLTSLDRGVRDVAVFSDGIEDLVLERTDQRPHQAFFDGMFAPVRAAATPAFDRALSRALRGLLTSERINERTDDDKSLVLATRR